MSTYRELTYQVLDSLKLVSDDSHFVEEHVLFLLDKYRCFLLKQRYADIRKEIPESNYQTICLDLEHIDTLEGVCSNGEYLKSKQELPHMMSVGSQKITTADFFMGDINYVTNERFKYVGYNKFLKNQTYATIGPDSHLYLKSNNCQMYYLEQIKITGIFENSIAAAKLSCTYSDCDELLDLEFPMEEALVPPLLDLIIKELTAFRLQPADVENNANDDLSDLASYIRTQLAAGRGSDLYKSL